MLLRDMLSALRWSGIRYRQRFEQEFDPKKFSSTSDKAKKQEQLRANQQSERVLFLRSELRYNPRWTRGHLLLGHAALVSDDIATSYASAQAVLTLASSTEMKRAGKLLLAKAHLRRGAHEVAEKVLLELHAESKDELEIAEELAAVYIALQKFSQAKELLERFPEDKLSQAAHAALDFVRSKSS